MRFALKFEEIASVLGAARQSPHAPRAVELAFALLIALQIWTLWQDALPAPLAASDLPSAAPIRPRFGASEISQLLGAHLFGELLRESTATPALAPTAFKLVGLYVPDGDDVAQLTATPAEPEAAVGSTGENGAISPLGFARMFFGDRTIVSALPGAIAWLSIAGAPSQRVQVGDEIGGGIVREIRPEGVMLELGGRPVRVAFPESPFLAMFRGEATEPTGGDDESIPSELTSSLLRLQPMPDAQGTIHFRIYPGANVQGFQRIGLRAGDEIEAIAGELVTTTRSVLPLLRALKDGKPVVLRLRRQERPVELTVQAGTVFLTPPRPSRGPAPGAKS